MNNLSPFETQLTVLMNSSASVYHAHSALEHVIRDPKQQKMLQRYMLFEIHRFITEYKKLLKHLPPEKRELIGELKNIFALLKPYEDDLKYIRNEVVVHQRNVIGIRNNLKKISSLLDPEFTYICEIIFVIGTILQIILEDDFMIIQRKINHDRIPAKPKFVQVATLKNFRIIKHTVFDSFEKYDAKLDNRKKKILEKILTDDGFYTQALYSGTIVI